MSKKRSRLEEEALETRQKAKDIQKQISRLSNQLSDPDRHFQKPEFEKKRSAAERFRRYFSLDSGEHIMHRKPTRGEMRAHRIRTLAWTVMAIVFLIIVVRQVLNLFAH